MSALSFFLEQYHQGGDEFLSHIFQVTNDETWISVVNIGAKGQSKQWMQTHSPNKLRKCKQMFTRKLILTVFWYRSASGRIHATKDQNDVKSILQNVKKLIISLRTNGMQC
jgi:hypothetical protein